MCWVGIKAAPVSLGKHTNVSVPSYRLLNLLESLEKKEVLAAEFRAEVSWGKGSTSITGFLL